MRKLSLAAGLLCTTLAGAALGSGYYVPKVGGDTAGPTTANGSALFWNPAAMSLIDGHSLFLEAQPVWRKNTYESSEPGQAGVADNTRWNVLPAAAATFTLHDRLKAGVGLFFPYGLGEDFKPSNGSQRFSIIYADLRSMFIMPSVSFDIYKKDDKRFTVAAGFVYARTSLLHYKALDSLPVISNNPSLASPTVGGIEPGNEARVKFEGTANNYSFDLGMLWQHGPLLVGASYIHSMNAEVKGTLQSYIQPTTNVPALREPMQAKANFSLPSTARLGAEYAFDQGRYTAKVQADWSHWSEFKTQDITVTPPPGFNLPLDQSYQRNFKNSFGARAGGSVFLNDWFQVLVAAGFDTAAVPNAGMTPEINDAFLVGASIGPKIYLGMGKKNFFNRQDKRSGLFMKRDMMILHALWNPLFYQTRDVTGSASLPATNGRYKTMVHMIALNVDYRF
ncbi:MAG: outer membrane protein transport protein [Deltaproteobacteria bacterium]|nr:outer membrane protein transport protein [Deltaproteobacteria bacterium]